MQPPSATALDSLTTEELIEWRDRAWRAAARAWADYRAIGELPDNEDRRALSNLLNADAWAAEQHWRWLYDTVLERQQKEAP